GNIDTTSTAGAGGKVELMGNGVVTGDINTTGVPMLGLPTAGSVQISSGITEKIGTTVVGGGSLIAGAFTVSAGQSGGNILLGNVIADGAFLVDIHTGGTGGVQLIPGRS